MPPLPFNDFVIHPRDNDLVLGSHGRGIWILDKISAIQELTAEVMATPAFLFSRETAEQIRRQDTICCPGDNIFYGQNPPDGAIIDYWLRDAGTRPTIKVVGPTGEEVTELQPTADRGIQPRCLESASRALRVGGRWWPRSGWRWWRLRRWFAGSVGGPG